MSDKIIKFCDNGDPRIDLLTCKIHEMIDEYGRGLFQLSTILGILTSIQFELMREVEQL